MKRLLLPVLLAALFLTGCQGSDTLDGTPIAQVAVLHQGDRVTLPDRLGAELCAMLNKALPDIRRGYDGPLDQPGTLVFLMGEDTAGGDAQVTYYLVPQTGSLPLLVRQEIAPDGLTLQFSMELDPTFVSPQYARWRGEVEEVIWDWEAERLAALAVPDFSDPAAIDAILDGLRIEEAVGPFTWEEVTGDSLGIAIFFAEEDSVYHDDFLQDSAKLFLELVENSRSFSYHFSEDLYGSYSVPGSAKLTGMQDFSGLYTAAQRHAQLPSPLFCPRFLAVQELYPKVEIASLVENTVLLCGDKFSVTFSDAGDLFDPADDFTRELELRDPIYEAANVDSMILTDETGAQRDFAEGCAVKTVYFVKDAEGQDSGFRVTVLDDRVYLTCTSEETGIERIFALCPEPAPAE